MSMSITLDRMKMEKWNRHQCLCLVDTRLPICNITYLSHNLTLTWRHIYKLTVPGLHEYDSMRWLLYLPADIHRGPSDLHWSPSVLARGPFGMFRGPFDSSRGPFGLIRGPSDQYRDPLHFSGSLWSVQDPLAYSVVLSTWKGTALAALSPCRHAQGPLRPPQGPLNAG